MRIGIEAFRIFRKHKHGIDIAALELIRQLQTADAVNEYFIFAFSDADDSLLRDTHNFKVIKLPHVWLPLAEQCMLPYYASKYKLDVLHCTGNTAPVFLNRKLIITLHDIIYLEKLNLTSGTIYQRMGNLYRRLIVPLVTTKADRIITVSKHERKNILKLMPQVRNKISVIHNACSDHFMPLATEHLQKEKARIGLPDKFVLYHGNTDPKKNVLNVLKAFAVLKEKNNCFLNWLLRI